MKNVPVQATSNASKGSLYAWLQLLRVSAWPTAISNILVGYLLANGTWHPPLKLVLLMAASGCLYASGMVLNDWFDLNHDRRQRPRRPLASGRISPGSALSAYIVLTVAGLLFAGLTSIRSLACAFTLVIMIVAYNGILKRTVWAPLAMGFCRVLNILLGASCGTALAAPSVAGFAMPTLWIAASLGIYVLGLTWFARRETEVDNRVELIGGTVVMVLGIAGYILVPFKFAIAPNDSALQRYIAIVVLISLPVMVRSISAIRASSPQKVGMAISTALRSVIFLDAAVAYLFSQCQVFYPLSILLLLIPALILSRWISPT